MMYKRHVPSVDCANCKHKGQSVLGVFHAPELEEISAQKGVAQFKKNQIIFKEGTHPQGLFCIHKGKVKISKVGSDGKEQIVRLAREGDVIGYRALLGSDVYSCSAFALDDSEICYFNSELIKRLLEEKPEFAQRLLRILALDLKHAEERIVNIAQKLVKERLADALLLLKDIYGYESDNETLSVRLKREDISGIVGTSLETIIRMLYEMKNEGYVDLRGKKIVILNEKGLNKLAGNLDI